jgi:LytS/YehU family sensor histidine kinase
MIIQPFVENSIWHGISPIDGKGLISIRFSLPDDKSLRVIVEDNGVGIGQAKVYQSNSGKHLSLGMDMTRKRLELLGRKYSVNTMVECSEAFPGQVNPGTRVTLIIPVSLAVS